MQGMFFSGISKVLEENIQQESFFSATLILLMSCKLLAY